MNLPKAIFELFKEKKLTLSLAESCTGGLIAYQLTQVAGISEIFKGSLVCYSNESKRDLLEVAEQQLQQHGAVSIEVASQMAKGASNRFGSDFALAVTGIAGPTGGSAIKPVGFVAFAIYGTKMAEPMAWHVQLTGSREQIMRDAAEEGLAKLIAKVS